MQNALLNKDSTEQTISVALLYLA